MDEAAKTGPTDRVGWTRLAIGFVQGLLIYGLFKATEAKAWPATDATTLLTCTLLVGYVPLVLLAGAGAMRRGAVAVGALAVGAALAAFAVHAVARGGAQVGDAVEVVTLGSSLVVPVFGAAWVFVFWHLFQAGEQTGRLVAPYRAYFDVAWQHAIQLLLAWLFTGVFWLVLFLGAALFGLIGIEAVAELITKEWFVAPATATVFAAAVHLTDVKASLTRGARTLALALLSWMTPLMGGLTIAFLLALPFTGLKPLFDIGSATAILLGTAAALIVFLNAAYHDGETPPPAILRWSGRAVAVALLPLLAIAAYGIAVRVGQYGWTPSRVVVSACVLIGAIYALGYAAAALIPGGPWMKRLEATNVLNAAVILVVLIGLFTPIADPARLAAASQVARLERGAVSAAKFDWEFLRFRSERYGREALAKLAESEDAAIAEGARDALALAAPTPTWSGARTEPRRLAELAVWPEGRSLPDSLLRQGWKDFEGSPCQNDRAVNCEAYLADLDRNGREEVLIRSGTFVSVLTERDGVWSQAGSYLLPCPAEDELRRGVTAAPPAWPDLTVGGRRVPFQAVQTFQPCPATVAAPPAR